MSKPSRIYLALDPDLAMELRRHVLDIFGNSRGMTATIERYIVDGLAADATPEGKLRVQADLDHRREFQKKIEEAHQLAECAEG